MSQTRDSKGRFTGSGGGGGGSSLIDASAFIAGIAQLQREIAEGYIESTADAVDVAKRSARESTLFVDRRPSGGTRSTIRSNEFAGYGEVRMGGAAVFLEAGTVAHPITATNAPALKFQINGRWISKKTVTHPGTQPRPVIGNAGQAGGQVLKRELDEKVDEAAVKFNGG